MPVEDSVTRLVSLVIVCGLLGGALLGCSNQPSPERVWVEHLAVVEEIVSGPSEATDDEVGGAHDFFLRLTGIDVTMDPSAVGWLTSDKTRRDVESLKAWYAQNGNRLYWDKETGKVQLAN